MPYRNRNPEAAWRFVYERGAPEPASLKAMPPMSREDVELIIDIPGILSPTEAKAIHEAMLDERQPLSAAADLLRVNLYDVLRARQKLEGSPRLKALQKIEGCKACGGWMYEQRADGSRKCMDCDHVWRFDVTARRSEISAFSKELDRKISVQVTFPTARGRHLIQREI